MDKLNFIVPDFLDAQSTSAPHQEGKRKQQKTGAQNVHPIEEQLKALLFVLYYLNMTCGFHVK